MRDHVEICQEFPGSKTVYMALTLDSAAEICWDVFKELNEKHSLGLKYNNTKKIVYFPNGSRTRLFGVDSNAREMRKILGGKLRKVSIDEAGSMTIDMVKLCYQVIMPALSDLRPNSWLTLLGTCENIPNTFFQQVTEGLEKAVPWKVFKWTAYDNPFMKVQWKGEIDDLVAHNPLVVEASWFKTHYLNQWTTDDNLLILDIARATYSAWAPLANKKVKDHVILGVDLGYNDACAYSLIGYNSESNRCWVIKSYKKPKQDITDTATEIKWIMKNFPVRKIEIDGANKQGVEEMRKRHGLPLLEAAEKHDKAMFLRLLRDDIITGMLQLSPTDIDDFKTEAQSLIWEDEDKQKEDSRCENHCVDSVLYAWRYAYSYLYKKPKDKPSRDSQEYMDQLAEAEAQAMRDEQEQVA